jgi:hypothetical protein
MQQKLKNNHGVIFAIAFICFGLLGGEFTFGIIHLITLWADSGGIIWFQAFTWIIAVLPLAILFYIFTLLHSQRGGGNG